MAEPPPVTIVPSTAGVQLAVREWKADVEEVTSSKPVVVLVHQYSLMGGSEALMRGLATSIRKRGYSCISFDLRGVGTSSGHSTLRGVSEVNDVAAVCAWASRNGQQKLVLVGNSAGAPIAGSALDSSPSIIAYIGIGYTFGWWASVLFGCHYKAIIESLKPKLFIMGNNDGFTSLKQLDDVVKRSKGEASRIIVPDVGHFELEGPHYDEYLGEKIVEFCKRLQQ